MSATERLTLCGPTWTVELTGPTLAFGASERVTVPLPVPVAPDSTEIPGPCGTTLQGQPAEAVTLIWTVPPEEDTPAGVVAEYEQLALAWVIENICPLMLMLPVRVAPVLLALSMAETTPEAVPEPVLTLIQVLSDGGAVHAQPLGAVTAKVRLWAP
jgi:hypothetical protein